MRIKDFLEHNVEGYLFEDIKNILAISLPKGKQAGAGGYPILMSLLAGIELLGTLLNPRGSVEVVNNKKKVPQGNHFTHYWQFYLSEQYKKYKGFGNLFLSLLRNGLAHTFVVKQNIDVYKDSGHHMFFNPKKPLLVIGCKQFFEDFKKTYKLKVKPLLSADDKLSQKQLQQMQVNLDKLIDLYSEESILEFNRAQPMKTKTAQFHIDRRQLGSMPSTSLVKDSELKGFTTPSGIQPKPTRLTDLDGDGMEISQ